MTKYFDMGRSVKLPEEVKMLPQSSPAPKSIKALLAAEKARKEIDAITGIPRDYLGNKLSMVGWNA